MFIKLTAFFVSTGVSALRLNQPTPTSTMDVQQQADDEAHLKIDEKALNDALKARTDVESSPAKHVQFNGDIKLRVLDDSNYHNWSRTPRNRNEPQAEDWEYFGDTIRFQPSALEEHFDTIIDDACLEERLQTTIPIAALDLNNKIKPLLQLDPIACSRCERKGPDCECPPGPTADQTCKSQNKHGRDNQFRAREALHGPPVDYNDLHAYYRQPFMSYIDPDVMANFIPRVAKLSRGPDNEVLYHIQKKGELTYHPEVEDLEVLKFTFNALYQFSREHNRDIFPCSADFFGLLGKHSDYIINKRVRKIDAWLESLNSDQRISLWKSGLNTV